MTIHEKHWEWIENRGLDPELAAKLGLRTVTDNGGHWLAIPYRDTDGSIINHKYRLTSEKRHRMDPGAPLILWNAEVLRNPNVAAGQQRLIITEGEWDAMAAMQAGFPCVVSVPNGAPEKPTEDLDTAARYAWIDHHAGDLRHVGEFVIATDSDAAGQQLRIELAALLGAGRCRFIEYPDGCKDLGDVLRDRGLQAVVECIDAAKPFPVKGLYTLDQFPERGEVKSYSIGITPIAELIHIVPGTLTVLTGYANSGKSTLLDGIVANALEKHFPVCLASFESEAKPILRDGLMMALLCCGKHDLANHPDRARADAILRDRLTIISQAVADEETEIDLAYFLELARTAVVRHGARMIVLDPWNELEHKRRHDETETEYIGRAIRAMRRFAKINNVAFWVVAHPAKPQAGHRGVPGLLDISGSAHWANKPDYGLTYHRPKFDKNEASIIITKVRKGLPGRRGQAKVMFDFRESRFKSLGESDEPGED